MSGLDQAQRYVDLLVARLERNQDIPAGSKLQAPILWLRKVIADTNPDFSAAEAVTRKREAQVEATLRTQEVTFQQQALEERKGIEMLKAKQLLDSLSEEELAILAEEAALEVSPVLGLQKRHEVRSLVIHRSLGTELARVAILKAAQRFAAIRQKNGHSH